MNLSVCYVDSKLRRNEAGSWVVLKVRKTGSAVAKRRVAACHRDAMKIYEQAGTRGTIESNDT